MRAHVLRDGPVMVEGGDAGLPSCTVCGGAEATLTLECPGVRVEGGRLKAVMANDLDFFRGHWWTRERGSGAVEPQGSALSDEAGYDLAAAIKASMRVEPRRSWPDCPDCGGSGNNPGDEIRTCSRCDGSGWMRP